MRGAGLEVIGMDRRLGHSPRAVASTANLAHLRKHQYWLWCPRRECLHRPLIARHQRSSAGAQMRALLEMRATGRNAAGTGPAMLVRISLPLDVLRSNVSPFWASTDTFQPCRSSRVATRRSRTGRRC